MSNGVKCRCQSCMIRGLIGPAVLITIGVLYLLNEVRGGMLRFEHTFPVILLVIGVIQLAAAMAPRDGHIDRTLPAEPPPVAPAPTAPPPQSYPPRQER